MENIMWKAFILGGLIIANLIVWISLLMLIWFLILYSIKLVTDYKQKLEYNKWLQTPEGKAQTEAQLETMRQLKAKLAAINFPKMPNIH